MHILIHPTYFPNVSSLSLMLASKTITFEAHDNYEKQTFRNRTIIYGANGPLALSIPVNYSQKNRQLYKAVTIANNYNWQHEHLKALQSSYESSPFYEHYIDDLIHLYTTEFKTLIDYNYACLKALYACLDLALKINKTDTYKRDATNFSDFRALVNPKTKIKPLVRYAQVFTNKYGFLTNLSALDLLFNEGPNTTNFLRQNTVELL